jgi:hypothetical protein
MSKEINTSIYPPLVQATLEDLLEGATTRTAIFNKRYRLQAKKDYHRALQLGVALMIHAEMEKLSQETN